MILSTKGEKMKPKKARIVIQHGKRLDLRVEIDVWDVNAEKLAGLAIPAGPSQADIDATVRRMKKDLERAGNQVEVIER